MFVATCKHLESLGEDQGYRRQHAGRRRQCL